MIAQAIRILNKDLRRQFYDLLVSLFAVAAYAVYGDSAPTAPPRTSMGPMNGAPIIIFQILVLCWTTLIIRLIQADGLVGDNQFWLTRPYRRSSLLLAKLLFLVLLVYLPFGIADTFVALTNGFPLSMVAGAILWRQVLITLAIILPAVTIAAITRTFMPAFLTLIVIAVGTLYLWDPLPAAAFLTTGWIYNYLRMGIVALGFAYVVAIQYRYRRTQASRLLTVAAIGLGAFVVAMLPWTAVQAMQSKLSHQAAGASNVQILFAPEPELTTRALVSDDGSAEVLIPVRLANVPSKFEGRVDSLLFSFESPDGARTPFRVSRVDSIDSRILVRASVGPNEYQRLRTQNTRLIGNALVTLWGNPKNVRIGMPKGRVVAPQLGVCEASRLLDSRNYNVSCLTAFRRPALLIAFELSDQPRRPADQKQFFSYTPFPADIDMFPLHQVGAARAFAAAQPDTVTVSTLEPISHLEKKFEIRDLQLGKNESRVR